MTEVLIAVQARSTSIRFPNKHMEQLGGRMIMDHVIERCRGAAIYVNRLYSHIPIHASVALLTPEGDILAAAFAAKVEVFEGPELDVLRRYKLAADHYKPDFIVRITGDCPLIPEYVISKLIAIAVKNRYDYLSNVDPAVRTAEDGVDCEVISRKMLDWMDEKATLAHQREHVTSLATDAMPRWARMGVVINNFDRSHVKLSVDTKEDLERVRGEDAAVKIKLAAAEKRYGKARVHRL